MEEKRFEWFKERFEELSSSDKLSLYNDYCFDVRNGNDFYAFDEEFFETYFSSSYDAARAVHFGSISWSDDYIRFDGRGNLESLSEAQLISDAEDNLEHIYEHGALLPYIDMDEFEDMGELKIEGNI